MSASSNFQIKVLTWLSLLALVIASLWLLSDIVLPFVLGLTIAYLLNPLVDKLTKWNLKRTASASLILLSFFVIVIIALALLIPILISEVGSLAERAPRLIEEAWGWMQPYLGAFQERFDEQTLRDDLGQALKDNINNSMNIGLNIVSTLFSGGQALISFFSILIITPVVSFMLLLEWPRIVQWLEDILPRSQQEKITELAKAIDKKIAGFVRGQILVAVSLGILYAVALTIAGLDFGALIGFAAGVLSIIPLLGSTLGLVISIVVAWFQASSVSYVLVIAAIFLFGQLMESYVFTPKLMGAAIGLHPLWILFSLTVGGALLGVLGLLLAVPVAASLGVLLNHFIDEYKESSLYKK